MTTRDMLAPIARELDRVADEGRAVRIFWRDDDAVAASPALERLLALAEGSGAPLALAAIPALVEPSLPERLDRLEDVVVLVHGLSHADHAPRGDRSAEFGPHRPLDAMRADLERALALSRAAFGARALPVFVPPWNRIAPAAAAALPALGYHALSALSSARPAAAANDLIRLDAHLDPVEWRGSRSLAPSDVLAEMMRRALGSPARPIGLLTHHLMFDERLWSFTQGLLELLALHPAVRLVQVATLIEGDVRDAEVQLSSPCLVRGGDDFGRRSRPEHAT